MTATMPTPTPAAAPPPSETVTIREAARLLGVSKGFVYRHIGTDVLPIPAMRFGRRVVVARLAIQRYIERHAEPLA